MSLGQQVAMHRVPLATWGSGISPPAQLLNHDYTMTPPSIFDWDGDLIVNNKKGAVLLGASSFCDVRVPGAAVTASILSSAGHVFVRPFAPGLWICLEDIASSIPLRDGMVLRFADRFEGPTIQTRLHNGKLTIVQQDEEKGHMTLGTYTRDVEIGRGHRVRAGGLERCTIPEAPACLSRQQGIFRARRGRWFLESQANKDLERVKSTWLALDPAVAYLLPRGGRIAFFAGEAGFQVQPGF